MKLVGGELNTGANDTYSAEPGSSTSFSPRSKASSVFDDSDYTDNLPLR